MFEKMGIWGWGVAGLCAILIGLSKTGLPGVGILVVPLMASIIPAKASTGVILPMLIFADFFAVVYYRRHAVWPYVARLLPWALLGILIGWHCMDKITDRQLKPIMGGIVLMMLTLHLLHQRMAKQSTSIPDQWYFAAFLGLLAGVTTMMANAAGPIMIIYLLAMRLDKHEFIGTGAWYFLILNCIKVPFSWQLGLISSNSLGFNLLLFPLIAIGALSGIVFLKKIPQKIFTLLLQILTVIAALNMLIRG